ncbi:outer membrane protein assembly factor BamD [Alloalcanivorax sp. C16-2]|uniref:outer membrane protein assembly factor BamD n=1 Tax=Alloalcanivorax TaxID=3020832 RepID=UPI0019335963|nr:outer membrane protein assembly factor BamD [Alloalcanivorax marinus]MBL7252266.1 outer membrane protein assembly factor BamD [Alloalcanivorax marinus]
MPRLIWPLLAALLLSACASKPEESPERTEAAQYREAQDAMDSNNYLTAIDRLKELEARFPYGRYAEQAQLDLIYAHFRSQEYPETVVAAQRFMRSYPAHPRLDYALYMRGLANFYMERGFFDSFMSTDKSSRDLGSARDAFEDFERLVTRFPDSEYAPDARSRMVFIRNEMARHELHAARYYARRGAYIAAINRAQYVVQHYQRTPMVPEALAIMVEGYERLDRPELADKSRRALAESWPDSEYLDDDGQVNLAWWPSEHKGLLSLLTFDLL